MNAIVQTPPPATCPAAYRARLATNPEEVRAAQRLRFNVFNLELNEGLSDSFVIGADVDEFDAVCDHLIVTEVATGQVVGTYRMQTGRMAAHGRGYYSAGEFDLTPFEPLRDELVELGRACVDRAHRNLVVLGLLWKGIADYATARGGRYLIGCSSLTSQDPAVGARLYADLFRQHLAPAAWRTRPRPHCECPLHELADEPVAVPKLLRTYLALGARICGAPALDREFRTIDFLTLLDIATLSPQTRARFFGR